MHTAYINRAKLRTSTHSHTTHSHTTHSSHSSHLLHQLQGCVWCEGVCGVITPTLLRSLSLDGSSASDPLSSSSFHLLKSVRTYDIYRGQSARCRVPQPFHDTTLVLVANRRGQYGPLSFFFITKKIPRPVFFCFDSYMIDKYFSTVYARNQLHVS